MLTYGPGAGSKSVGDGSNDSRVLLVSMPWMTIASPCPAFSILRPILEGAGVSVDTLYGTLQFPRTTTDPRLMELVGPFLFAPLVYPKVTAKDVLAGGLLMCAHEYIPFRPEDRDRLRTLTDLHSFGGLMGWSQDRALNDVGAELQRAASCLQRCLGEAAKPCYDIVGFSLLFESQLVASVALARRLKQLNPLVRVVLGGAACAGELAQALLEAFSEVDVVCHCEGDRVIVPLVRALRGAHPLSQVPGIVYRDEAGSIHANPAPPLVDDLDSLPLPSYRDYFTQLEESEWRDLAPEIYLETSRGCWWAQKKPCNFCALQPDCRLFRSKSGDRVFHEISRLCREYPAVEALRVSDNVLDVRYFRTLFPRLARMQQQTERPPRLFFEVRPNLTKRQVALLAEAGVDAVLAGLESFDDDVLELMNKGTTALRNVQLLKWLYERRIKTVYNIIVATPGETTSSYRHMLDLLPFITHLPPPNDIHKMVLMRHSAYFASPDKYGISNVRPKPYYAGLYRDPAIDRGGVAHNFDFDHEIFRDATLHRHRQLLFGAVMQWQASWKPGLAHYIDRDDRLVVVDRRENKARVDVIAGRGRKLFRFMDQTRTLSAIGSRFAEVAQEFLDSALMIWQHRRWICRDPENRYLAVLPVAQEQQLSQRHRSPTSC